MGYNETPYREGIGSMFSYWWTLIILHPRWKEVIHHNKYLFIVTLNSIPTPDIKYFWSLGSAIILFNFYDTLFLCLRSSIK